MNNNQSAATLYKLNQVSLDRCLPIGAVVVIDNDVVVSEFRPPSIPLGFDERFELFFCGLPRRDLSVVGRFLFACCVIVGAFGARLVVFQRRRRNVYRECAGLQQPLADCCGRAFPGMIVTSVNNQNTDRIGIVVGCPGEKRTKKQTENSENATHDAMLSGGAGIKEEAVVFYTSIKRSD